MNFDTNLPDWVNGLNCAVTVCDTDCIVIYQNERSRITYAKEGGDLRGRCIIDCHNPRSQAIIHRLLNEGGQNCYTISKQGQQKMIFQSAWRRDDGSVGGIAEFSIILPDVLPHYDRG